MQVNKSQSKQAHNRKYLNFYIQYKTQTLQILQIWAPKIGLWLLLQWEGFLIKIMYFGGGATSSFPRDGSAEKKAIKI